MAGRFNRARNHGRGRRLLMGFRSFLLIYAEFFWLLRIIINTIYNFLGHMLALCWSHRSVLTLWRIFIQFMDVEQLLVDYNHSLSLIFIQSFLVKVYEFRDLSWYKIHGPSLTSTSCLMIMLIYQSHEVLSWWRHTSRAYDQISLWQYQTYTGNICRWTSRAAWRALRP